MTPRYRAEIVGRGHIAKATFMEEGEKIHRVKANSMKELGSKIRAWLDKYE